MSDTSSRFCRILLCTMINHDVSRSCVDRAAQTDESLGVSLHELKNHPRKVPYRSEVSDRFWLHAL
jgi:hypothetical protein